MSLRSGTQKYGTPVDEFVDIDGHSRNLALEERLKQEFDSVTNEVNLLGEFSPSGAYSLPSWWGGNIGDFYDVGNYGFGFTTHQKALDYMKLSQRYYKAQINLWLYQCNNYPGNPSACQHAIQYKGILAGINSLIPIIEARVPSFQFPEILPEVFAEEDPSVNSGLNGNERESVAYPQSANVRIVISNISMFSTSIPINDISQLQILSNESNEWRYTLIGTSTNQPLMALSGLITKINSMIASAVTPQPQPQPQPQPPQLPPIEEPPITTDHVEPPEVEPEVPMVTVTPTEPGQVNWIPEPFFSFINNVFRR